MRSRKSPRPTRRAHFRGSASSSTTRVCGYGALTSKSGFIQKRRPRVRCVAQAHSKSAPRFGTHFRADAAAVGLDKNLQPAQNQPRTAQHRVLNPLPCERANTAAEKRCDPAPGVLNEITASLPLAPQVTRTSCFPGTYGVFEDSRRSDSRVRSPSTIPARANRLRETLVNPSR